MRLKGRMAGTPAPAATNLFPLGQNLCSVLTVQVPKLLEFVFCSCNTFKRGTPSTFLRSFLLPGCVQKVRSHFICCTWRIDLSEEARCRGNRDFINVSNKSSLAPVPFWQHLLDLQLVEPLLSPEVGNFLSYPLITAFVFWPLLQELCVFIC